METAFVRQFDLQAFRQRWKDWSFKTGMQYVYKHIFVGIHTPVDKRILHNNIESNWRRNVDI